MDILFRKYSLLWLYCFATIWSISWRLWNVRFGKYFLMKLIWQVNIWWIGWRFRKDILLRKYLWWLHCLAAIWPVDWRFLCITFRKYPLLLIWLNIWMLLDTLAFRRHLLCLFRLKINKVHYFFSWISWFPASKVITHVFRGILQKYLRLFWLFWQD